MRFILPIAVLAVAFAALIMTPPTRDLSASTISASRARARRRLRALAPARRPAFGAPSAARLGSAAMTWAALLIALTGLYAYRFEFSDFADRVMAELIPSEPHVGRGGEVIVNRRLGGEFVVAGRGQQCARDSSCSTPALRRWSSAPRTRGGRHRHGRARLRRSRHHRQWRGDGRRDAPRQIAVGPIVVHNVSALIARHGALTKACSA